MDHRVRHLGIVITAITAVYHMKANIEMALQRKRREFPHISKLRFVFRGEMQPIMVNISLIFREKQDPVPRPSVKIRLYGEAGGITRPSRASPCGPPALRTGVLPAHTARAPVVEPG